MKKILFAAAALLMFASCGLKEEFQPVFSGVPDAPAPYKYYQDSDFAKIITIADLASCYTPGKPFIMPAGDATYSPGLAVAEKLSGAVIKGRVSTTDKPGNFYKSFYIEDETGGMEIKMGKNGLYNDYLPGQTVYVKLEGLTLGMYGYKTGNYGGMGMVQVGFADPSAAYETSYFEIAYIIDKHILRGNPADAQPVVPEVITESQLPNPKTATQKTNKYVGKLVTLKGLKYADEMFCLLYLDSSKDKKSYTNRVFLSDSNGIGTYGKTHGVTTWAMSESKMKEYLFQGLWDECKVGSGNDYLKKEDGTDCTVGDLKGDGTYPGIEKAAYSVSQYFKMGGTEIQIRTSGYSKFGDCEIPSEVLSGAKSIDVTGILTLYQGSIQFTVNDISDFVVDGKPLEK